MDTDVIKLGKSVEIAYANITANDVRSGCQQELMLKLDEYDLLVDKLVELTNGKESAYFTDPMQADDYKLLLGKSINGMSYNDMAEELGAKFISST